MASFGEILAELRRDRNLRQEDLAKILHVSLGTICNYEKDVQIPPMNRVMDIADFFNVTTDYLMGRCSISVSPDLINQEILPGWTAGAVMQSISELSPDRKRSLATILYDMKTMNRIIDEVK